MPPMLNSLKGVSFKKHDCRALDKELQARGFFEPELMNGTKKGIVWTSPYDPAIVVLCHGIQGEMLFRDNWKGGATIHYRSTLELLKDLG